MIGLTLLVVGVGTGMIYERARLSHISHEAFCANFGVDYLESIKRNKNIDSERDKLFWQNGITTETKLVNLCNSQLDYPDLSQYEIEKLAERKSWQGKIELGNVQSIVNGVEVRSFYLLFEGKKVSGIAHVPIGCTKCPVIVQIRGYYDRDKYFSGAGTRRTALEFAKAGYVTMAPDFLGYGDSDMPSDNVFEARFQTYTTIASMVQSTKLLNFVDPERIGIWGHSNGGQIALTMLEIVGEGFPTALWAPVTANFPYSILYYTHDYEDGGKALRKDLARMEEDFDVEKYVFENYLERIKAPILIQQGTSDQDVPVGWSREVVRNMTNLGVNATHREYGGADHNMIPKWDEAVRDDIEFFDKYLK